MSLAMLLDHVGESQAALWIEQAVEEDLAARGNAVRSTSEIGSALADACVRAAEGN
jgi:3-isopropylmalate dehydrogenase